MWGKYSRPWRGAGQGGGCCRAATSPGSALMSDPSKKSHSKEGRSDAGCPMCGKAVVARFSPFCSARCTDLDLGRWLKGGYVIPAAPDESEAPADRPGPADDDPTT